MAMSKIAMASRMTARIGTRAVAPISLRAVMAPSACRTFGTATPVKSPSAPVPGSQPAPTTVKMKKVKMTTEEAFVKMLQMRGISNGFGIIGSAMMPISDLFPAAGIKFWDCAHEYNAGMMSDGYTRVTGNMSMMIAQNGPGITNFVTPVKTAYWNHTPLLLVTPQAANKTIGQGGFQEVEQMAMFRDCVCYQEEVRDPSRIPEVLNRVIEKAIRLSGPAQINIPRDMWTKVIEVELPEGVVLERSPGGPKSVAAAADLLSQAKFPVILNGAGVILSEGGIEASRKLAERLSAPVACNYQHNDAFPGSHPLYAGPLGYNGSKAAMELIAQADVVLALGTRLNPFSTLPAYNMSYWPEGVKLIQVDINEARIGLTKPVTVGIQGDAAQVAEGILAKLSPTAGNADRANREALIKTSKSAWVLELEGMNHEQDDDGTTWNERARARDPERMSPRMAWRAIQRVMPKEAIMSSDIGNNCAIGNAYPSFPSGRQYLSPGLFGPCGYGFPSILGAKIGKPSVPVVGFAGDGAFGISMNELTACGRNDWPAVTMVVFRNYQWGAEKRNTTLWYKDNFVGTELNVGVEYAKVAQACGLKGVKVDSVAGLEEALSSAIEGQMQRSETTLIEVVLNQELGEPFRRDAMTAPVAVAGVSAADMREV
jgi:sulfoacetaldehyde acetyltransferase